MSSTTATAVRIDWPTIRNVHGGAALWFAAWLTGDAGSEAASLYSGRGGTTVEAEPPPGATGIRVYRWPNEGLDPEYCDIDLPAGNMNAGTFDFDRPQRFSRLRLHPDD